jgi:hypothetical protein
MRYESTFPTRSANSGVKYNWPTCRKGAKRHPTVAPYTIRDVLAGGVVRGSASITNAKKRIGVSASNWHVADRTPVPFPSPAPRVTASAAPKKLKIKSDRANFLATRSPPTSTKGSMANVPTHQLAAWFNVNAAIATANAAGLKICFLRIARMYFDAIAHTPAQSRNAEPAEKTREGDRGVMIKARIKAVI